MFSFRCVNSLRTHSDELNQAEFVWGMCAEFCVSIREIQLEMFILIEEMGYFNLRDGYFRGTQRQVEPF